MVKKKSLTAASSSTTGGAAAKSSSTLPKKISSDAPPPAPVPPAPPSSIAKPGDWLASSITKRDEKRARSLGLVSSDEGNVILPGAISRPNPPAGFTVVFLSFLYRGLSLPAHEFLLRLLRTYEIQLWQLTPNSILHVVVFITLCGAFLGIEPHFGLWKKIFYVKRYSSSNGSFVIGGVGFVARSEVNYFSFPMRESVQGWRLKWFYVKDSLTTESQFPRFADVLEAKPKDSWKNTLSPDERAGADELFAKFLRIKEADGQTMIGTEVAAVFLKRRVQPVMARVRPMWLYSGPKDETRINIAELSEKELLDEVRRLTLFSQEDSIPLISSYTPLDANHPPSEIRKLPMPALLSADDACDTEGSVRDDDADRDAFADAAVEEARASPAKRSTGGFADEDDLFDIDEGFVEPPAKKAKSGAAPPDVAASEASVPKAAPAAQVSTASSLCKGKGAPSTATARTPPSDLRGVISSLEAFASQFTSLEAEKVRLQKEVKSSSSKLDGAFKIAAEARQEVDSLKEELGKLREKLREEEATRLAAEARAAEKDELLRQSSLALLEAANIPADAMDKIPNNSPANGVSMTLASHQLTRELLEKGKGVMARMHSMIFPKISQDKTLGQLIDAFAVNTKEVIEVFKRTSRTYGAVLAFQLMMGHGFKADIEEMSKELPKEEDGRFVDLSTFKASAVFPVPAFVDDSSGALSEDDRVQRMKDRITQLEKDLRSTYALAAIIKKKCEIAADVERYALTELHKATESLNFIALNRAEESKRIHERVHALTQLSSAEEIFWREHSKASAVAQFQDRVHQVHHFFDKCYKALRIRDLVRAQVFAGARFTLALVLARYPSADLLTIANAVGDLETLYPKVLLPANIIVDKLEKESKVPEE
ncbi:hypothetical protein QYE76_027744 [Lolium multiflorum]|uniref:Transposase (putative) gypsy type domain-containing protein n=1 Tax=Lolium multiflorum TaxID=4521 RepID=A0AAD8VGC4_LOLMU|nr:hypothetical protein QYE76_027744 [Lolium multiflorum]